MQTDIKLHSDYIPGEEKSMGKKLQKGMENLVNPPVDKSLLVVSNVHKEDPNLRMNAIEWYGTEDMRSIERLAPDITDPQDAIVKITTSTVCGSDLHMYYNQVPGAGILLKHDILGHEAVGIVAKVGPSCKNLSVGDRVVISAVISCGECKWCKQGKVSLCDKTNPSTQLEKLYGQRLAGIFGYTHLTGGYAGLQAEYARVPLADNNTLKITNKQLKDKQLIVLSDILCTGWHGLELGSVNEGDNIAIWGAGPVGLMATLCAIKLKKVNRVIVIDNLQWRLDMAAKLGAETLNFNEVKDVPEELRKRIPDGPDVCIECAGFRYTKSLTHKLQSTLKLETDTVDIVNEMILSCQKGGRLSLIGDYFGYTNNFPIGAMMEKNLTVQGGQVFVQKYWNYLLKQIETGVLDPTFVFTHNFKLEDTPKAYKAFAEHDQGFIKPLLLTKFHNLSA